MYFRRIRLKACELRSLQTRLLVASLTSLYAVCSPVLTRGQGVPSPRPPLPAIPLAHEMFGNDAVSALGTNLPAVAVHYRKTPTELKALLRQDHSLHVDRAGRLYHVCNWPAQMTQSAQSADVTTDSLL